MKQRLMKYDSLSEFSIIIFLPISVLSTPSYFCEFKRYFRYFFNIFQSSFILRYWIPGIVKILEGVLYKRDHFYVRVCCVRVQLV